MTGFVYVVAANLFGPVKIGQTTDPRRRIPAIACAIGSELPFIWVSPECVNYAEVEQALHTKFARRRQRGEWFKLEFNDAVTAARNCAFIETSLPDNWAELMGYADALCQWRRAASKS